MSCVLTSGCGPIKEQDVGIKICSGILMFLLMTSLEKGWADNQLRYCYWDSVDSSVVCMCFQSYYGDGATHADPSECKTPKPGS